MIENGTMIILWFIRETILPNNNNDTIHLNHHMNHHHHMHHHHIHHENSSAFQNVSSSASPNDSEIGYWYTDEITLFVNFFCFFIGLLFMCLTFCCVPVQVRQQAFVRTSVKRENNDVVRLPKNDMSYDEDDVFIQDDESLSPDIDQRHMHIPIRQTIHDRPFNSA